MRCNCCYDPCYDPCCDYQYCSPAPTPESGVVGTSFLVSQQEITPTDNIVRFEPGTSFPTNSIVFNNDSITFNRTGTFILQSPIYLTSATNVSPFIVPEVVNGSAVITPPNLTSIVIPAGQLFPATLNFIFNVSSIGTTVRFRANTNSNFNISGQVIIFRI